MISWHCSGGGVRTSNSRVKNSKQTWQTVELGQNQPNEIQCWQTGDYFSAGGIDANSSEIGVAGQCCRRESGDCWRSWTDCKSTMPYCCQNPNNSHLGTEQIEFVTCVNPRRKSLFPTQNQKSFSWSTEYPVSRKYILKNFKNKNFWESWTDLNKLLSGAVKDSEVTPAKEMEAALWRTPPRGAECFFSPGFWFISSQFTQGSPHCPPPSAASTQHFTKRQKNPHSGRGGGWLKDRKEQERRGKTFCACCYCWPQRTQGFTLLGSTAGQSPTSKGKYFPHHKVKYNWSLAGPKKKSLKGLPSLKIPLWLSTEMPKLWALQVGFPVSINCCLIAE